MRRGTRNRLLTLLIAVTLSATGMLGYDYIRSCRGSIEIAYTSQLADIMTYGAFVDGDDQCAQMLKVLLQPEPLVVALGQSRLALRYRFAATALSVDGKTVECEISYRGRDAADTLSTLGLLTQAIVAETEQLALQRQAAMRRFAQDTLADLAAGSSAGKPASGPAPVHGRKSTTAADAGRWTPLDREQMLARLNEVLVLTAKPPPESECREYSERLDEFTAEESLKAQTLCSETLPLAVTRWPAVTEHCRATPARAIEMPRD